MQEQKSNGQPQQMQSFAQHLRDIAWHHGLINTEKNRIIDECGAAAKEGDKYTITTHIDNNAKDFVVDFLRSEPMALKVVEGVKGPTKTALEISWDVEQPEQEG